MQNKKNKFKDNEKIFYYNKCKLIDEETIELFYKNNKNKNDIEKEIKNNYIKCIFGSQIILIIIKEIINIGHLDNNDIFNTELIVKMKEKTILNELLNKIKIMKYEGFKNMPLFNESNISNFDNWNFFIFKLFDDNEKNNNINKVIVNIIFTHKIFLTLMK